MNTAPCSWTPTFVGVTLAVVILALAGAAQAEDGRDFPPERIRSGAAMFARNCSPCHGAHMIEPQGAFDLRTFPHDQHDRFVNAVTNGKNQMPPWRDLLKPDDVEALWAYVVAGEKE
jgi:mono/diheme cytochrome c family protein